MKLTRQEIFPFGEDDLFGPSTLKPVFWNWSCLIWAKPPEMGSKQGSLGAVDLGSVCVPLSEFAAEC